LTKDVSVGAFVITLARQHRLACFEYPRRGYSRVIRGAAQAFAIWRADGHVICLHRRSRLRIWTIQSGSGFVRVRDETLTPQSPRWQGLCGLIQVVPASRARSITAEVTEAQDTLHFAQGAQRRGRGSPAAVAPHLRDVRP